MKSRFFILSALLPLFCFPLQAQSKPESFYGLKLGEKYSEKTILNAMIASGIDRQKPIARDTLKPIGRLAYTFDGVMFRGNPDNAPVTTTVTIIVSDDYTFDAVILTPDEKGAEPIGFISDAALPDLMHFVNANTETVEDTFFGLTLGSDVSLVSVTKAVGTSGSYDSSRVEARMKTYTFTGVTYAGHEWDYGQFTVNRAGKLVSFTVYDVYEGRIKGYHPANSLQIKMRDLYFKEYGFSHAYDQDGNEDVLNDYVFTGQNGVDHIISFFDTETDRGKDAYCVQMEFVHDALNRNL